MLALGRPAYDEITSEDEGGFPLRYRIEEAMTDGRLIWAPALEGGGVLISARGGDYELTVGQDLSIGYLTHDADTVQLYMQETLTFQCYTAEASVALGP